MSNLKKKAKTLSQWYLTFRRQWTKTEMDCYGCKVIGTGQACSNCEEVQKHLSHFLLFEDAQVPEKKLEELKQKLQRWFEDLGRWILSQRKDWSHPELPEDLKERFMELLEEEKEAKT